MARRDVRLPVVLATLLSVGGVGWLVEHWGSTRLAGPESAAPESALSGHGSNSQESRRSQSSGSAPASRALSQAPAVPADEPSGLVRRAGEEGLARYFQQGVLLLQAHDYADAAAAFHEVLRLAPSLPEAHVNMGFALLGLERPAAARDFFLGAVELRPSQVNAYYGLATALEQLGDLPGARGAMGTYVHLAEPEDPYLARARAALWEWGEGPEPADPIQPQESAE